MDATPEVNPPDHIPPKVVSLQASSRFGGKLERRMAGEFPVLEAFQQFLEAERRRARQHLIMVTCIFVIALAAVVGAGVAVGLALYHNVTRDLGDVASDLQMVQDEQAKSGKTRAAAEKQVQKLAQAAASEAASLRKQVKGATAKQQHALNNHQNTIDALQQQLSVLEKRNQELNADLQSVQQVVPSLSSDLGIVVDLLEDLRAAKPPLAAPSAPAPPSPSLLTALPAAHATMTMVVFPRGSEAGIPWRLPIPE